MTDAIYDRTITVYRSQPNNAVGVQGYSGLTPAEYAPVFVDSDILDDSDIPIQDDNDTSLQDDTDTPLALDASIQEKGAGTNPVKLPSDGAKVMWKIHFRAPDQTTPGLVKDRDLIIDDEGIRYQVVAARHTLLNWQCLCERLEA